jgi:hypothetical protein
MEIRHDLALSVADVVFGDGYCVLIHDYSEGTLLRSLQKRAKERSSAFPLPIATRVVLDVITGIEQSRSDCDSAKITWKPGGTNANSLYLCGDGRTRVLDGQLMATMLASKQLHSIAQATGFPAPELLESKATDEERTDVFAVGALLWELLSAKELLLDVAVVSGHKLRQKVPSISLSVPKSEKPVPLGLAKAITSSLELDPSYRLGSLTELKASLVEHTEVATYAQVIDYVDNLLHRESTLFRLDLAPPPKLSAQQPIVHSKQPPPKPKQTAHLIDLAKVAQARETANPPRPSDPKASAPKSERPKPSAPARSKPPVPSGPLVTEPEKKASVPSDHAATKPIPTKEAKALVAATKPPLTLKPLPSGSKLPTEIGSSPTVTPAKSQPVTAMAPLEAASPTDAIKPPVVPEPAPANLSALIAETVIQGAPAIEKGNSQGYLPDTASPIAGALASPLESLRTSQTAVPAITQPNQRRVVQLSLPTLLGILGGVVVIAVFITAFIVRGSSTPTAVSTGGPTATQPTVTPSNPATISAKIPDVSPSVSASAEGSTDVSTVPSTPSPSPVASTTPKPTLAPQTTPAPPLGSPPKPAVNGITAPSKKVTPKPRKQYVPSEL